MQNARERIQTRRIERHHELERLAQKQRVEAQETARKEALEFRKQRLTRDSLEYHRLLERYVRRYMFDDTLELCGLPDHERKELEKIVVRSVKRNIAAVGFLTLIISAATSYWGVMDNTVEPVARSVATFLLAGTVTITLEEIIMGIRGIFDFGLFKRIKFLFLQRRFTKLSKTKEILDEQPHEAGTGEATAHQTPLLSFYSLSNRVDRFHG
ncbi:MAG: hypothetical protein HYW89_01095 [Candidatus Sungiibacteriota bacterium]|uniref:Uncharacterized protein n=1 Tax=Candidatus Sungiibacteriota bacterium TaxID=2750080 RepID=A0A7T5RJV7_9BACT|nr:MAG: hypothetical protein HYW89_01095 [Candidatus Sungbacteria bacterium]